MMRPKLSVREERTNTLYEHVGNAIRQRRTLMGLSQEQLAEALSVPPQQVAGYEAGASRVPAVKLLDLSRALDVPIGYFYSDLSEDTQAQFVSMDGHSSSRQDPGQSATDSKLLNRAETLEVIRDYYRIPNPAVRARVRALIKSLIHD